MQNYHNTCAQKLLHLHVFCGLLYLLLSKLKIDFKTLIKNIKSYKLIFLHI